MGSVHNLRTPGKTLVICAGLALVALIGYIDDITGPDWELSIFFLIPVVMVDWFAGRRWGVLMSALSASVWLWSDFRTGHHYSSPMVPYWSTLVRLGFFLIVNFTLDSLKRSFAHEKELARTDSLTGLANARAFYAAAEAEFNRSRRTGSRFSVAYLDLDNFKRVNDRFGHNTGDEVLRILGETLRAHIRACDTAARLGGDEFALLFSESDHEEALHALRRIREDTLAEMRARTWPVTLSAGLVTFGQLPDSIDEMVRLVDNLMYEVKNNGKNAIREAIHGGAAELTA